MIEGYVYIHLEPNTSKVFYVGESIKKTRPFDKRSRNSYWHHVVKKNKGKFDVYIVEVVKGNTTKAVQDKIKALEIQWISYFNQADVAMKEVRYSESKKCNELVNLTDGGGGTSGYQWSDDSRQLLREIALKRPPMSDETRKKIGDACRGEKNWNYGRTLPQWQRDAISKAMTGMERSKEFCENQSKNAIEWHENNEHPMKGKIDNKNPNSKAVICLVTKKVYASATLYMKDTGMSLVTKNCHITGHWNTKDSKGNWHKITNRKVMLLEEYQNLGG